MNLTVYLALWKGHILNSRCEFEGTLLMNIHMLVKKCSIMNATCQNCPSQVGVLTSPEQSTMSGCNALFCVGVFLQGFCICSVM